MNASNFKGTFTALVTPFSDSFDQIDFDALQALVEKQVAGKVDGIVPVGTTGESPTLSMKEHLKVIKKSVEYARGRVKVLAGTGSNNTREAIELTRAAQKLGVDGSLQVVPYYNKPTQAGLLAHFGAIAKATSLPIMLYNVPSRAGADLLPETIAELAHRYENIIGVKEASGKVERVKEVLEKTNAVGRKDFIVLSGDDALTYSMMRNGAHGVVSVASNIIPAEVSTMVKNLASGQHQAAHELHIKYEKLFGALFIETNPAPVKAALGLMGVCSPAVRLPLVQMTAQNQQALKREMENVGLTFAEYAG